jgi:hypothetical protein
MNADLIGHSRGIRRTSYYVIGALMSGVASPIVVAIVISLAAFFPVGQFFPRLPIYIYSVLSLVLCILLAAAVVLIVGPILAVKRRSWWPVCLAVLAIIGAAIGYKPSVETYASMRWYAFDLMSARSADLVKAIESYQTANKLPPASLGDLVPDYLRELPRTGMAANPTYEYSATPGPCSKENRWHLWISAGEFFSFDYLFFCPLRDYDQGVSSFVTDRRKTIGDWVYQFEL